MVSSSIKVVLWLVASTSVSQCELYSEVLNVLDDDVLLSSHSWHALHEFTDQHCHSASVLLILMHELFTVITC